MNKKIVKKLDNLIKEIMKLRDFIEINDVEDITNDLWGGAGPDCRT